MKMRKIFLLLLIAFTGAFYGCKKENHEIVPPPENTSELNQFYKNNRSENTQYFTVDANSWQTIVGNKGTKLSIPADAFVYSNGSTVSGSVDIELIEVLNVSDMVKNRVSTISNNEVLVSGGQLKVVVTQNSNELLLKPGYSISVDVPTNNPDPQMALFTGDEGQDGDISWTSASTDTSQTDSVVTWTDSTGTSYYNFAFDNDSLGWINCDYWWNTGQPLTTIQANIVDDSETHDNTNTTCFLVFPQINSVIQMYNTAVPTQFESLNIPINQPVTFCCISEVNGTYYSAFVSTTVVNNHVENITLTQTTLNDLNTAINNL